MVAIVLSSRATQLQYYADDEARGMPPFGMVEYVAM